MVYGTYQSYLRRGIDHLRASLSDAKKEEYILGVKLVRGAYHTLEVSTHAKGIRDGAENEVPPVWMQKNETDATYNAVSTS
jgi:proline dehydrogenase